MRKTLSLLVVILAVVIVSSAVAADSVLQGYGGESTPVVQVAGAATEPTQGASTLPFTGADLSIVLAAGLVLVGVGVGLRRLGRSTT